MNGATEGQVAPQCRRFQAIDRVLRDSVVELSAEGEPGTFVTTARLDSGFESRMFSHQALTEGDARFTVRRSFYVVTFVTQFLSKEPTTVTLGIGFASDPPPTLRCSVSGKRDDRPAVNLIDLETGAATGAGSPSP